MKMENENKSYELRFDVSTITDVDVLAKTETAISLLDKWHSAISDTDDEETTELMGSISDLIGGFLFLNSLLTGEYGKDTWEFLGFDGDFDKLYRECVANVATFAELSPSVVTIS